MKTKICSTVVLISLMFDAPVPAASDLDEKPFRNLSVSAPPWANHGTH